MLGHNKIYPGDCREVLMNLPDGSINCCVTSPPYFSLRDYENEQTVWDGDPNCKHIWDEDKRNVRMNNKCVKCGAWKGSLGLEPNADLYIKHLCEIFDEIKRVLADDGTCWVNLGDTYSKDKSLCMIPSRFAIEMINHGWILRNEIIWKKPNCMPSSVKDRFTVDFECVLFFVKNKKYFFRKQYEQFNMNSDVEYRHALRRNKDYGLKKPYKNNFPKKFDMRGRNKRTVWEIPTRAFPQAHFAVYPEELCETPIRAGCPKNGIVVDPFFGAGTTGLVALKNNRKFIGIESNPDYIRLAKKRLQPYLEQTTLHAIVQTV